MGEHQGNMKIVYSNEGKHREFLGRGLENFNKDYNINLIPYDNKKEFGFYAYDGDKMIGGVCGQTDMGNWCEIELLFINEAYRDKDLGTKLIEAVEKFAIENDCLGVRLKTWSWQARGFYEKMGFILFGELKDHPFGGSEFHLAKRF